MKKLNILFSTAVLVFIAFCDSVRAEIFKNISCGENCTGTYDTGSQTMTFTGSGTITGAWKESLKKLLGKNYSTVVKNVIIEEGLVRTSDYSLNSTYGLTIGSSEGSIKIPSTWRNPTDNTSSTYGNYFGTFEIAATNSTEPVNLDFGMPSVNKLILSADNNMHVRISHGYETYPANVDVQCRGDKTICEKMVQRNPNKTAITVSYYTGPDDNGNWEVWSDDGLALYADSTKQKLLAKYDLDGNQTGVYKYDGAGNLTAVYENGVSTYKKTSYTPAEAAAAVKKGNKNTITFTFK